MASKNDNYLNKPASDSKDVLKEEEDPERTNEKITSKDHDAPVTAADIEFIENFDNSPAKSRLMRKVDLRMLPILILLYLVSFIGQFTVNVREIVFMTING